MQRTAVLVLNHYSSPHAVALYRHLRSARCSMGLGNAELPMLHFWRLYPGYEHYWIVEYDVRFSGCWREFFRYWDENDADLLSTTLTPYEQCREWPHWDSLRTSECDDHSTCVRDFFPVYRIAQPALTTLDGSCRACAAGHMEALLPSTLKSRPRRHRWRRAVCATEKRQSLPPKQSWRQQRFARHIRIPTHPGLRG
jgi:hypothetical protein